MNDEEAFQAALDANPDDHVTRLVFADWLDEHDDPRAEGYRALGVRRLYPVHPKYRHSCWLSSRNSMYRNELDHDHLRLPAAWYAKMRELLPKELQEVNDNRAPIYAKYTRKDEYWVEYYGRVALENAAALAFLKLPAKRRAHLLATEVLT